MTFALTPIKLRSPSAVIPEAAVVRSVRSYLNVHPAVAWAHRFNVGAHQIPDEIPGPYPRISPVKHGPRKRRFIRYAFPGCSDFLGQLKTGEFLAVECKRPGEKPTDTQRAFLALVNESGGLGLCVSSLDELEVGLATFLSSKAAT